MLNNDTKLPETIWVLSELGIDNETIIQECTLLEVTYDRSGLEHCYYQTPTGNIYSWSKEHKQYCDKIFSTREQAIEAVETKCYSFKYMDDN